MKYLILFGCFLGLACGGTGKKSCSALPAKLQLSRNDTIWNYKPSEASLSLDFANYLFFSRDWCALNDYYPYFKVELISTTVQRKAPNLSLKSREAAREKCRKSLKKDSFIQSSAILHVNQTTHVFHYVQGMYYVRLSACSNLEQCQNDLICSGSVTFSADVAKNNDVCEYDFPSNVSADIIDTSPRLLPRFNGQDLNNTENWYCDIALRAIIPLCTAHQSYDTVTVTAVEVAPGNDFLISSFAKANMKA